MKKILVVLTILVLVAGFAFADISGKVTAEYAAVFSNNYDGKETAHDSAFGYAAPNKSLAASVTLDKQIGGKTGEVKPYIDLKISAEFTLIYENSENYASELNKPTWKFKLDIDTFAIVGEDWKVNLLKAEDAKLDLAKSAIDSVTFNKKAKDENTQYFSMAKAISYTKGISVTYKDFVVGLGFNTVDFKDTYAGITLEVKTPEFTFDAVKVQAGAGFSQKDATDLRAYVGSAKVAYEAETVDASVAADFSKSSADDKVKFDLAAHICVAPVTVDVFFGNNVKVTSSKYVKAVPEDIKVSIEANDLLSAKAVVDVAKIAENLPVKLTITGKDLLNRYDNVAYHKNIGKDFGKIVDVEVNTTALANFDITATAGDVFNKSATFAELDVVYTGIANIKLEGDVKYTFAKKNLDVDLSAEYTAEKYTAKASVGILTDFEDTLISLAASVESEKLVDGAKLTASYGTIIGYTLADSVKVGSVGVLGLACEVKF